MLRIFYFIYLFIAGLAILRFIYESYDMMCHLIIIIIINDDINNKELSMKLQEG